MSVMQPRPSLFDVSCVLHVHSTYSDGTATVAELLAGARMVGADALLLTDHDSLQARRDPGRACTPACCCSSASRSAPTKGTILRSASRTKFPTRAGRPWRSPRRCGRQVGSGSPPTHSRRLIGRKDRHAILRSAGRSRSPGQGVAFAHVAVGSDQNLDPVVCDRLDLRDVSVASVGVAGLGQLGDAGARSWSRVVSRCSKSSRRR